jgi:TRAP-type C4-dicarboxylate transport system permease small subunit
LSAVGIVLVVSIQVVARLFLPTAPAWTEEAARMCFLFLVAFAAALAVRDGAFVSIDTLLRLLPPFIATTLQCMIHLTITALMILVAWYAIPFVRLGVDQKSPCLQIPMAYVHGSVLLLALTVVLYSAFEVVHHFGKLVRPETPK